MTFCTTCGSSFGVKLCPKLHPNPLAAQYCSTCGSRQLSRPHRARKPTRAFRILITVSLIALAIIPLSIGIAVGLATFGSDPSLAAAIIAIATLLVLLFRAFI